MEASHLFLDSVLERSRLGGDGFDCFPEGHGHRLQLWGRLPSRWAGNLALHATIAGLRIVTGDALRTRSGTWAATFLLRTEQDTGPLRQDFLNMARRGPRMVPDLPRPLVRISARLSHDSPGNVYAQVTGKDSVGLLAEIVRRFESCDLQPRRLVLRTRGEEVEDWFWLEPKDDRCADRATLCELERGWATRSGTFPV